MRRNSRRSSRRRSSSRRGSKPERYQNRYSRADKKPSSGPFNGLLLMFMLVGGMYYINVEKANEFLATYMPANLFVTASAWVDKLLMKSPSETEPSLLTYYTMPCLEANVAKTIATTLYPEEAIQELPNDAWYSKYYRALQSDTRFSYLIEENSDKILSDELLTLILKEILGEGYVIQTGSGISFEQFLDMYIMSLNAIGEGDKIKLTTLSIVSTPANNSGLLSWNVLTNDGVYNFEGLILDPFVDYTLEVAIAGDDIIGITNTIDSKSTLEQCYIVNVGTDTAIVRVGEKEVTYKHSGLQKSDEGSLMTLIVQAGTILDFITYMETAGDIVLRITNDYIEFEEVGKFTYDNVAVYDQTYGGDWTNISQVASGSRVEYVMNHNNEVTSLKILSRPDEDDVRVVITEDGLGDYIHSTVSLDLPSDATIYYNEQFMSVGSSSWNSEDFDWEIGDKVIISADADITITSITRQSINPSYVGTLEIYKEANGYTVVNEVDMNNYLARVITSEMPTAYGLEACKVQAISARSYAIVTQRTSKFMQYGAQVDDTVASQVYNNVPMDSISYEAATSTDSIVLKYDGNVISGNFFSTSAGYTANFGEVWATGEIFPSNTPVYLSSRQQYLGDRVVTDISNEEDAYTFFTMAPDEINAFDNHAPWFRWELTYSGEQLSQIINSNIERMSMLYSNLVKVLYNNTWQAAVISSIGDIQDIEVKQRGEGGNIMSLIIIGESDTIQVESEYLIRTILAPAYSSTPLNISRGDGSTHQTTTLLPSAFFSMDVSYNDKGEIEELTLYGGGNGHGVGMSQEGVKGMVDRGYTYKQIIEHYYQDVEIEEF
ncbi:MAG: hypothetical protein ATN34_04795 [Epulopiscium sp. Nele67-Bin002]|nr:MAG: hypothetical protein ATN33_03160 [Epulopiscium sp. Nele67-Bin001]OON90699.1 MAG: hypothetical protein ATN34_04795 [Epulopiscium sp. Nele67-Bin002]